MLKVTYGNQRGRRITDHSVTPGDYVVGEPCYVIVVKRQRVQQWRAMWYFPTQAQAEAAVARAWAHHKDTDQGGRLLDVRVAEGRVFEAA
jgi:hypothetical protein